MKLGIRNQIICMSVKTSLGSLHSAKLHIIKINSSRPEGMVLNQTPGHKRGGEGVENFQNFADILYSVIDAAHINPRTYAECIRMIGQILQKTIDFKFDKSVFDKNPNENLIPCKI